MEIKEKSFMPDGTTLQIEDWSEDYTCHFKNATIGFYPVAVNNVYGKNEKINFRRPPYPERGKTFRASMDFKSEEDASKAFASMVSGEKSFMDYMEYYSSTVISKEYFSLAVGAGCTVPE